MIDWPTTAISFLTNYKQQNVVLCVVLQWTINIENETNITRTLSRSTTTS